MPLNKFKTVFIDFDGTLSTSRFMEPLAVSHPEIYSKFQKVLLSENDELVNRWMLGEITAAMHERHCPESWCPEEFLVQELEYSCRAMKIADPSVMGLIEKLRNKGALVVIATNNMDTFNRWTVEALSLHDLFDHILNSAELGAFKKDVDNNGQSTFFGSFLDQHHLLPEDCILLDDVASNQAVEAFGMKFMSVEWGTGLAPALKRLLS